MFLVGQSTKNTPRTTLVINGEILVTAQEELEYIKKLHDKVEEQKYYIEELRSSMSGVTAISYDKEAVQTSGSADPMLDTMIKIETAQKILQKLEMSWLSWKVSCIDKIHLMQDPDLQKILYLIYIDDLTLKECAVEMCWSYGYTRNRHSDALKQYDKM